MLSLVGRFQQLHLRQSQDAFDGLAVDGHCAQRREEDIRTRRRERGERHAVRRTQ